MFEAEVVVVWTTDDCECEEEEDGDGDDDDDDDEDDIGEVMVEVVMESHW